ncbi:hypothetical protein [Deinococcus apachensis]|uniref:hypothetical protein n=1 Tax=Deinococcus apachensis TaxID=309886 RepID=UPI000369E0A0|nr:hypothetical protein [Deinococcus apachensis]
MSWPRRLIVRAAQIQGERDAEARLTALTDASIGAGLKFGREYIDPDAKKTQGGAYYSFAPLQRHQAALERQARPWLHTPEAIRQRREAEEDALWDQAAQVMGGARA